MDGALTSNQVLPTRRLFTAGVTGAAVVTLCAAIFAGENAVHIRERPRPDPRDARGLAAATGSEWQTARLAAADGTPLDGWVFRPAHPNGGAAILLHGVADTRAGVLSQAAFLLHAGYFVLTPDARGHGASGGSIITYGVREAGDVHSWADWLLARTGATRLYGLGESMGAAILLQSLAIERRFRAVAAECPFADFESIAFDRMKQAGAPHPLSDAIVPLGLLYGRLRYGIDLRQASPEAAVRATSVPVLLIHGTADDNIPLRHSRRLHAANPRSTVLWEVPGAGHANAIGVARDEYTARVLDWFARH